MTIERNIEQPLEPMLMGSLLLMVTIMQIKAKNL